MSLENPTLLERAIQHKRYLIYAGLAILLIGVALFLYDCGDNYLFKSKIQKDKDAIKAETNQIANITNQIQKLELDKVAVQSNINAATEELQKNIYGLEEAKKETNSALANLQQAVNANTNVDRSVADMHRVLDQLDKMDR